MKIKKDLYLIDIFINSEEKNKLFIIGGYWTHMRKAWLLYSLIVNKTGFK